MIALLAIIVILLLLVSVGPALSELLRKTDVEPIAIANRYAEEIERELEAVLPVYRKHARQHPRSSALALSGHGWAGRPVSVAVSVAEARDPIVLRCTNGDELPSGLCLSEPAFAASVVRLGARSSIDALFAGKDVYLNTDCTVRRWLHSDRRFTAGARSRLSGSVSARESVMLEEGSVFERIHAPRIGFGIRPENDSPEGPDEKPKRYRVTRIVDPGSMLRHPYWFKQSLLSETRRTIIRASFELARGSIYHGNLVVSGKLRIGANTIIYGSVKAGGDLIIESHVKIYGSAFSEGNIVIETACYVEGIVNAENTLRIDRWSVVGAAGRETSVSGRFIRIVPPVRTFGTVWATEHGFVEALQQAA